MCPDIYYLIKGIAMNKLVFRFIYAAIAVYVLSACGGSEEPANSVDPMGLIWDEGNWDNNNWN